MKISTITITVMMLFVGSQVKSQIKIHDDNHVSLGSLTKGGGLQLQPEGYIYHQPTYTASWAMYSNTYALNQYSKINIVTYNGAHKYFVLGNGRVYSNGSYHFSDSTLKTNILPIESALEKIKMLRGVSFDFKKDTPKPYTFFDKEGVEHIITPVDGDLEDLNTNEFVSDNVKSQIVAERERKHLGFIAQEIEEILPEVVRTTPSGEKSVAYYEILALCVEAIKELEQKSKIVDELQTKYHMLSQHTNKLEKQLLELKAQSFAKDIKMNAKGNQSRAKLYQNNPNLHSIQTQIKCDIPENIKRASLNIDTPLGYQR